MSPVVFGLEDRYRKTYSTKEVRKALQGLREYSSQQNDYIEPNILDRGNFYNHLVCIHLVDFNPLLSLNYFFGFLLAPLTGIRPTIIFSALLFVFFPLAHLNPLAQADENETVNSHAIQTDDGPSGNSDPTDSNSSEDTASSTENDPAQLSESAQRIINEDLSPENLGKLLSDIPAEEHPRILEAINRGLAGPIDPKKQDQLLLAGMIISKGSELSSLPSSELRQMRFQVKAAIGDPETPQQLLPTQRALIGAIELQLKGRGLQPGLGSYSGWLDEIASNKANWPILRIGAGMLVGPTALVDIVPGAIAEAGAASRKKISEQISQSKNPVDQTVGGMAYALTHVGEFFAQGGNAFGASAPVLAAGASVPAVGVTLSHPLTTNSLRVVGALAGVSNAAQKIEQGSFSGSDAFFMAAPFAGARSDLGRLQDWSIRTQLTQVEMAFSEAGLQLGVFRSSRTIPQGGVRATQISGGYLYEAVAHGPDGAAPAGSLSRNNPTIRISRQTLDARRLPSDPSGSPLTLPGSQEYLDYSGRWVRTPSRNSSSTTLDSFGKATHLPLEHLELRLSRIPPSDGAIFQQIDWRSSVPNLQEVPKILRKTTFQINVTPPRSFP